MLIDLKEKRHFQKKKTSLFHFVAGVVKRFTHHKKKDMFC